MRRAALLSVAALAVGVAVVVWNEIRQLGQLAADAINGRPS